MGATLVLIGVGCIIAAIVGGGVKLQQLEVAKVSSLWRQGLLGGFGLAVSSFGFAITQNYFSVPAAADATPAKASVNAARDVSTGMVEAATNTAVPADTAPPVTANPPDASAEKEPEAPAQPREAKPPPAPDADHMAALNIGGYWVDGLGNRWRIIQVGPSVDVYGARYSADDPEPTMGSGSLTGNRLSLDLMGLGGETHPCSGKASTTSISVTCRGRGDEISATGLKRP